MTPKEQCFRLQMDSLRGYVLPEADIALLLLGQYEIRPEIPEDAEFVYAYHDVRSRSFVLVYRHPCFHKVAAGSPIYLEAVQFCCKPEGENDE